MKNGDALSCTVQGIRPIVQLRWRSNDKDSLLTFVQLEETTTEDGDTFHANLTIKVTFPPKSAQRFSLECLMWGQNAHLFNFSKTVDIIVEDGK